MRFFTTNLEMVKSIGAAHVVDYTKTDFTKSKKKYDLILDNVGNRAFSDLRSALKPEGKLMANSGHAGMSYVIKSSILSLFMKKHSSSWIAKASTADYIELKKMAEEGKIKPIIDKLYPIEQTAEAMDYLSTVRVKGKLVIKIK